MAQVSSAFGIDYEKFIGQKVERCVEFSTENFPALLNSFQMGGQAQGGRVRGIVKAVSIHKTKEMVLIPPDY
jgi:hypothetical protein